jgi:hypothetical protein
MATMSDSAGLGAEVVAKRWLELYNDVEPGTFFTDRHAELHELVASGDRVAMRFTGEHGRSESGTMRPVDLGEGEVTGAAYWGRPPWTHRH